LHYHQGYCIIVAWVAKIFAKTRWLLVARLLEPAHKYRLTTIPAEKNAYENANGILKPLQSLRF